MRRTPLARVAYINGMLPSFYSPRVRITALPSRKITHGEMEPVCASPDAAGARFPFFATLEALSSYCLQLRGLSRSARKHVAFEVRRRTIASD